MIQAKQLPLPIIPRPVAELVCEKWRAILGTKAPVAKPKAAA